MDLNMYGQLSLQEEQQVVYVFILINEVDNLICFILLHHTNIMKKLTFNFFIFSFFLFFSFICFKRKLIEVDNDSKEK